MENIENNNINRVEVPVIEIADEKDVILDEAEQYITPIWLDSESVDKRVHELNLKEFVHHWARCAGYSQLALMPVVLTTISRVLGSYFEVKGLEITKPRPNIFLILSARPDFFHKTSLMQLCDDITKDVEGTLKSMPVIHENESLTFDGSIEGLIKVFENKRFAHYSVDEFYTLIKMENSGKYDAGRTTLLLQVYDGKRFTQSLKDPSKGMKIEAGYYATMIATMHPGELNGNFLRIGLARRCWDVSLRSHDMVDDSIAYRPKANQLFQIFKEVFTRRLITLAELIIQSGLTFNIIDNGEGTPTAVPGFTLVELHFDNEILKRLEQIRHEAVNRVSKEDSFSYPFEDPHLLNRIAINFALAEGEWTVEPKHLDQAIELVKETTKGYIDELKKLEESLRSVDEKHNRVLELIKSNFASRKKSGKLGSLHTSIYEATKYDNLESIYKKLSDLDKIIIVNVKPDRGKTKRLLFPSDVISYEQIENELNRLKNEGKIHSFMLS